MTLQGYTIPRTPAGRASLVPAPPWHYVGDFLVVDFHADPEAAISVLPEGLDPHPDPGRCAAVFADWQSCSEGGDELLDPVRSHYREFYLVVNALLDGEEVTTCPFIWVDQDFALARGWIQGFPKKLGEVWMTRTYQLACRAAPGVEAGSSFGGTCSARGHALARARVTLQEPSAGGSLHTAPSIVNVRHFPRLAAGRHDDPQVHELVRSRSRNRSVSEVWEGDAELELFAAPGEEHTLLSAGRRSCAATASRSPTRSTTSRPSRSSVDRALHRRPPGGKRAELRDDLADRRVGRSTRSRAPGRKRSTRRSGRRTTRSRPGRRSDPPAVPGTCTGWPTSSTPTSIGWPRSSARTWRCSCDRCAPA